MIESKNTENTVEKFGFLNILNILLFIFEVGNIAFAIKDAQDKTWKRFLKLIDIADEAFGLVKTDYKLIKDEYIDLSIKEREQIKSTIKAKFDIADDLLEEKIEKAFEILFDLEGPIRKAINLFRK